MRRAALLLALAAACSRGDPDARARLLARDAPRAAPAPVDPAHPAAALALSAGDTARALGASFEWTGAVDWTVAKTGEDARRVHVAEHHRLRQLATGEFEVRADVDPGGGAGTETGRQIVFTNGTTYARALPAPYRVRPTDLGRDARRYRDESFRLAGSIVALYGDALRFEPAGETTLLGRRARRYRLSFARPAGAAAKPSTPPASGPAPDPDTARHRAFLEGRVPLAADGELVADAETGVPLRLRLTGAFGVSGAAQVRAEVELLAQVTAIGAAVHAVGAPANALPDERKPAGPSSALEAAGLKKRGEEKPSGEPGDEPE